MPLPGDPYRQQPVSQSSIQGLSLAGMVLPGLYVSIVADSLFPMQLLSPGWQLKVGTTLLVSRRTIASQLAGLDYLGQINSLDADTKTEAIEPVFCTRPLT